MQHHPFSLHYSFRQGFTNPRCQVAQETKFCSAAPNTCRSSVRHLLHVTVLVSIKFLKNCALPPKGKKVEIFSGQVMCSWPLLHIIKQPYEIYWHTHCAPVTRHKNPCTAIHWQPTSMTGKIRY